MASISKQRMAGMKGDCSSSLNHFSRDPKSVVPVSFSGLSINSNSLPEINNLSTDLSRTQSSPPSISPSYTSCPDSEICTSLGDTQTTIVDGQPKKILNLWYNFTQQGWMCSLKNDKVGVSRYFSVKKYGYNGAKQLAIGCLHAFKSESLQIFSPRRRGRPRSVAPNLSLDAWDIEVEFDPKVSVFVVKNASLPASRSRSSVRRSALKPIDESSNFTPPDVQNKTEMPCTNTNRVSFNPKSRCWIAYVRRNQSTSIRRFQVKKLGFVEARRQAVECAQNTPSSGMRSSRLRPLFHRTNVKENQVQDEKNGMQDEELGMTLPFTNSNSLSVNGDELRKVQMNAIMKYRAHCSEDMQECDPQDEIETQYHTHGSDEMEDDDAREAQVYIDEQTKPWNDHYDNFNSTGLPQIHGVSYNRRHGAWITTWREKGESFQKSFYVAKHGYEGARELAIGCRLLHSSAKDEESVEKNIRKGRNRRNNSGLKNFGNEELLTSEDFDFDDENTNKYFDSISDGSNLHRNLIKDRDSRKQVPKKSLISACFRSDAERVAVVESMLSDTQLSRYIRPSIAHLLHDFMIYCVPKLKAYIQPCLGLENIQQLHSLLKSHIRYVGRHVDRSELLWYLGLFKTCFELNTFPCDLAFVEQLSIMVQLHEFFEKRKVRFRQINANMQEGSQQLTDSANNNSDEGVTGTCEQACSESDSNQVSPAMGPTDFLRELNESSDTTSTSASGTLNTTDSLDEMTNLCDTSPPVDFSSSNSDVLSGNHQDESGSIATSCIPFNSLFQKSPITVTNKQKAIPDDGHVVQNSSCVNKTYEHNLATEFDQVVQVNSGRPYHFSNEKLVNLLKSFSIEELRALAASATNCLSRITFRLSLSSPMELLLISQFVKASTRSEELSSFLYNFISVIHPTFISTFDSTSSDTDTYKYLFDKIADIENDEMCELEKRFRAVSQYVVNAARQQVELLPAV